MKKLRFVWIHFWPTFLVIAIIVLLSLLKMPSGEIGVEIPYFDKIAHFCMYGGLLFVFRIDLLRISFHVHRLEMVKWIGLGLAVLLGGGIELLQGVTSYRSADWYDMLANTLGAFAGFGVASLICAYYKRMRTQRMTK